MLLVKQIGIRGGVSELLWRELATVPAPFRDGEAREPVLPTHETASGGTEPPAPTPPPAHSSIARRYLNPDQAALLAAIADRPDDDTPRLVYADWLDDHGQGDRADFIRHQCEAARLRSDNQTGIELNRKAAVLFDRYKDEWWPFDDVQLYKCRRGFYQSSVSGQAVQPTDAVARALCREPVADLVCRGNTTAWLASPYSRVVTNLMIDDRGISAEMSNRLDGLAFERLRKLGIHSPTPASWIEYWESRADIATLESLHFSSFTRNDGQSLNTTALGRLLDRCPVMRRLTLCQLGDLGDQTFQIVAESAAAATLEFVSAEVTEISIWGLAALARCPRLNAVRVSGTWNTDEGRARLAVLAPPFRVSYWGPIDEFQEGEIALYIPDRRQQEPS